LIIPVAFKHEAHLMSFD